MSNNRAGYLDQMRMRLGADRFRSRFRELRQLDPQGAVRELNSEQIQFPTFFLLIPEIEEMQPTVSLNMRNALALKLCKEKSVIQLVDRQNPFNGFDSNAIKPVLQWIYDTGCDWEAPAALKNQYDAVIDTVAALLIVTYGESSILPSMASLLFQRNHTDYLVHDLIWCYCQACEPDSLRWIAAYLSSDDPKDRSLACKLLHLQTPDLEDRTVRLQQYNTFLHWLDENRDSCYFSGEHMQQTSDPELIKVNLEAKYLCKKISPKDGSWVEALSAEDVMRLDRFRSVSRDEQELLSSYSHYLAHRNIRAWNQWMQDQTDAHISAAKSGMEVL